MRLAKTIEDIFSHQPCRFENEPGEYYVLTIVDRMIYPRLWRDGDLANSSKVVSESDEHILVKNNPFLERDWLIRFECPTIEGIVEEYNNWIKRGN